MAAGHETQNDIYTRLIEQGTSEEEIEEVYRKLRSAGYGEEQARRRLEAAIMRRRNGQPVADRRGSQEPASSRGPRGGDQASPRPAGDSAAARRMEDWFPDVPRPLRRRVNKWAYQNDLAITGLRERWFDFLSRFKSSVPDPVNPRLLALLAPRKHYLSENPYSYTLATTLDAMYTISRTFLGRSGGRTEDERTVGDALRRREPFARAYLEHFAHHDAGLRQSLGYLELAHEHHTDVPVSALARVTREVWRLVLTTEQVSRKKVDHIFSVASDVLQAYGSHSGYGLSLEDSAAIFQIGLENLQRFKLELYPVVLKAIRSFYPPDDDSPEKRTQVYEFLDLKDEEILTVRRFYQQEAQRKEKQLAEQQLLQLEQIEREKEAGFSRRFEGLLSILDALFPDSGIRDLERSAFLIPYFDERVFVQSLPFDHGAHDVEVVSRFDPLQPVMVLHRIVDNLLSSIDHARLEVILGRDGLSSSIAEIRDGWADAYNDLFAPYLRALTEYARATSDEADARRFPTSSAGRRLEEEINQLRNRAIRNYGHAVLSAADSRATRIWMLAERLTLQLDELGEEFNQDLGKRADPLSRRVYEELGRKPVVDFREHATPGTTAFKPVVRQLRRYIEAKYRSSLASLPRVSQLFLFDLLRGVAELYRFVLNDEASFVRTAGGRILVAGEEEAQAWKAERNSRSGDLTERLRIRLDEHLVSEYTDSLTGMKTKNFLLQKMPDAYTKAVQARKPISILMIDIDHFKWVNDELGHQKGDEVLRDAATTVLDGTRRGNDIAIRYGGEELLVVTPAPLHNAIALAERLRHTQHEHLGERDLYAPIAAIGEERGEPCGTFSVGVVERSADESLDDLVARADRALYRSKQSRDAVTIGHAGTSSGEQMESFADYAARVRTPRGKTASEGGDRSARGDAGAGKKRSGDGG